MADNLLYEQSNESQMTTEPFVSRQVVYVVDQNNGAYNGQIQLDTSSLSNSGKYASYSEGYFEIPLVLTLTSLGDAAGANIQNLNSANYAFAAGLKAGYWHLLHSFSVEYNNTSVVQLTPFSNMYIHYKMMTSMSGEDVEKFGSGLGFYPDRSLSFQTNFQDVNGFFTISENPNTTTQNYGTGIANNRNFGVFMLAPQTFTAAIPANQVLGTIQRAAAAGADTPAQVANGATQLLAGAAPNGVLNAVVGVDPIPLNVTLGQSTLATGWVSETSNFGFYKRQQSTAYANSVTLFTRGLLTNPSTVGKNQYVSGLQVGAANDTVAWYILAKIRLKDMCDFFDKLPLVKGAYLRFIINVNTTQHTLQFTRRVAVAGTALSVNSVQNQISGGTSPLLLASSSVNQGANALYGLAGTAIGAADGVRRFRLALDIAKVAGTAISHPTLQQCRLYVPLYQMNPTMEEQYLSLNRTKKVVYRDIYQYQTDITSGLDGGGTFNVLLTNGIPNPKFIIVIPMIRGATSPTINAGVGASAGNITGYVATTAGNPPTTAVACPTWQSPFTTEPATTSPLTAITNFNIQIAGQNMFIQNELYDFEQFTNELQSANAINGGLVTGLTSGLISETDFQYMYRYYICDVSRRLPAEDRVPKSVQILGQSLSLQPITLYTFIEFEREIEIDLITGQKLS